MKLGLLLIALGVTTGVVVVVLARREPASEAPEKRNVFGRIGEFDAELQERLGVPDADDRTLTDIGSFLVGLPGKIFQSLRDVRKTRFERQTFGDCEVVGNGLYGPLILIPGNKCIQPGTERKRGSTSPRG